MERIRARRRREDSHHRRGPACRYCSILPVIVFFVVYRLQGIYAATAAIIATMALQIAYQWFRYGKVNKMFLASGILVALLGGITLALRNPLFIQWKPTS